MISAVLLALNAAADPCPPVLNHWWQWHLYEGVSVVVLALVGVLAPLLRPWERIERSEKALWTLCMLLLAGSELWAIRQTEWKNARERDHAFCEQQQNFQQIANGINASIANSQLQFSQTMQGLQTTITGTQQAIKNTTPYADIQMDWMSGAIINGSPTTPVTLAFGAPTGVNLFYHNAGLASAKNVRLWLHFYIGKPDNLTAEREIERQFVREWKTNAKPLGAPLAPGTKPMFSSFFQTFSSDDAAALRSGQTIYRMIRFEYTDQTGDWYFDDCEGYQEPLQDMLISHPCLYLKRKRHPVS